MREFSEVDEFQTVITREGVRDEITLRVELKPDWRREAGTGWRDAAQAAGPGPRGAELPHRARRRRRAAALRAQGQAHRRQARRADRGGRHDARTCSASEMSAAEERLLAVYEELKALCGEDLPPVAAANIRAALALMHNVVNGLALRVRAPVRPGRVSAVGLSCMRIAVVGGGPGGLYFSILMRRVAPDCEIVVFERNRAQDAFGFGVVFSDETLTVFEHADPLSYARSPTASSTGPTSTSTTGARRPGRAGTGSSALGRRELLGILQRRALSVGVEMRFECEAPSLDELGGARPGGRRRRGVERGARRARAGLPAGRWILASAATCGWGPTSSSTPSSSTSRRRRRRAAGARLSLQPRGEHVHRRDRRGHLAPGRAGRGGGRRRRCPRGSATRRASPSARSCSPTPWRATRCSPTTPSGSTSSPSATRRWRSGNVVLVGDAAHTAHFSIGSGTKLAMEDAVALAWAFRSHGVDDRSSRTLRGSGGIPDINQQLTRAVCIGALRVHPVEGNASH